MMQSTEPADQVVLVDERDRELGSFPKLQAHQEGRLHRALSVLVFNTSGELLMQRRAIGKYHSGGLWSNTCCTHPGPGEPVADAARRRLFEEMRLTCEVERVGEIVYRAEFESGLVEHEYDHLFIGRSDADPRPNADEVADWRWMSWNAVRLDLAANPAAYTRWLGLVLDEVGRLLDLD